MAKTSTGSGKAIGFRATEPEYKSMKRLNDLLHQGSDADALHSLLIAVSKRSDRQVLDFLFETGDSQTIALDLQGSAPCGEWGEISEIGRPVLLSADVAHKLGVRPGDFIVEARGSSMVSDNPSEHIPHGAWLLMRPDIASEGEVCLLEAQIDGQALWTVKRHSPREKEPARLKDGSGKEVSVPEGANLIVRGVKRGIIAR